MTTWARQAALNLSLVAFAGLAATGCTKTFTVRPVPASGFTYAPSSAGAPAAFTLDDARSGTDKPLNAGTLNIELEGMSDEIAYLGDNLAAVLRNDGIQVAYEKNADAPVKLKVLKFRIRNERTSGFSPYHTFTMFSGDLTSGGPPRRITAFFKNSKTPIWAFSELERPCYQIPIEVAVREIAAKLNEQVYHRAASDSTVLQIVASIPPGDSDSGSEQYLKVLQLGFTNNPTAIPPLVQLTKRPETLMRASALSALGTLGAKDQFPLLKEAYESKKEGSESVVKLMALKSIGDIDTPEGNAYLRAVKASPDYQEPMIREVIDLYP